MTPAERPTDDLLRRALKAHDTIAIAYRCGLRTPARAIDDMTAVKKAATELGLYEAKR